MNRVIGLLVFFSCLLVPFEAVAEAGLMCGVHTKEYCQELQDQSINHDINGKKFIGYPVGYLTDVAIGDQCKVYGVLGDIDPNSIRTVDYRQHIYDEIKIYATFGIISGASRPPRCTPGAPATTPGLGTRALRLGGRLVLPAFIAWELWDSRDTFYRGTDCNCIATLTQYENRVMSATGVDCTYTQQAARCEGDGSNCEFDCDIENQNCYEESGAAKMRVSNTDPRCEWVKEERYKSVAEDADGNVITRDLKCYKVERNRCPDHCVYCTRCREKGTLTGWYSPMRCHTNLPSSDEILGEALGKSCQESCEHYSDYFGSGDKKITPQQACRDHRVRMIEKGMAPFPGENVEGYPRTTCNIREVSSNPSSGGLGF